MSELPKYIQDFTAFIDGVGMAGRIEQGTLPNIALATDELSAGGLGGKIDLPMGMLEKMESELTMYGFSPDFTRMLGQPDGALTLRGAISDGASSQAAIFQMRGLFKGAEFGDLKRADKGSTKIMATLTYFKAEIAGREVIEADIINKVFRVHGVDLFEAQRAALGL